MSKRASDLIERKEEKREEEREREREREYTFITRRKERKKERETEKALLKTGRSDWRRFKRSSPSLFSCAIDSSAISHRPLQGGKKARVNAAAPRRQSVGKNFVPLTSPSCYSFSFFLSYFFFFLSL